MEFIIMRSIAALAGVLVLSCASAGSQTAAWISPRGTEQIPVVRIESAEPNAEVVMTTEISNIDVPTIRQEFSSYGRMVLTVWIRNSGRSPQMADVKAKFFDRDGRMLEATGDWDQVFLQPGEATQINLLCGEEGAATFKVLLR